MHIKRSPVDVWTSNKSVPATYKLLSDINYIYKHILYLTHLMDLLTHPHINGDTM